MRHFCKFILAAALFSGIVGCSKAENSEIPKKDDSTTNTPSKDNDKDDDNGNNTPQSIVFTKELATINNTKLPYREALIGGISTSKKGTLALYLHGGSSKGNDNEAQMTEPGINNIAEELTSAGGTICFDIEQGWDHATTCTDSYTTKRLEWVFSQRKE